MNKKVKIYSTPSCHFCHMVKDYLEEKGVEYEDHNVAKDKEELQNMMKISGQLGVPVVEIGEDVVIGFNKPILKKLLGIT